jgi:hypothetical protein
MRVALLAACIVASMAAPSQAVLVVFDLFNRNAQAGFDGVAVGTLSLGGVTATFTASAGVLNSTASLFGVDGGPGDQTEYLDQFNSGGGTQTSEFVTITFSVPVTLTSLSLEDYSPAGAAPAEQASATVAGTLFNLAPVAAAIDVYAFNDPIALGQTLVVRHIAGNGFSFRTFTVDFTTTAQVPEVSSILLGGSLCSVLGVGAGIRSMRRKRLGDSE